jgi:hypothetical protein
MARRYHDKAVDRLGRSLIDLLDTIQHLEACGVDLYLDQQAIDTTTPMGKLVFQVTGAFAEFERTMIRQRIKAGLKRAVAQGVKLGRPKIDSATERKVRRWPSRSGSGLARCSASQRSLVERAPPSWLVAKLLYVYDPLRGWASGQPVFL